MPIRKQSAWSCPDLALFSSFLHGVLDLEDVVSFERHLLRCEGCRTRLHLWRHHSEHLFEDFVPGLDEAPHGCLSRLQLEHFEREDLSEGQLVRMQGHVARCLSCWTRLWDTSTIEPDGMAFFSTRVPDVNLRLGSGGVDIREGRSSLLPDEISNVSDRPSFCFRLQKEGSEIELRLGLPGSDVLRVEVRWVGAGAQEREGSWWSLWTRKRILRRLQVVGGCMRADTLPLPGCYFVGCSVFREPLLGIWVDRSWSTISPRT